MNPSSINQHYTQDHERLDALFHRFQELKFSQPSTALRSFEEFKAGLEKHIAWEEEILFPCFEEKTGMRHGPTEVMRWEHREIRKHLAAIEGKLARNENDTAADEADLKTVLSAHNQKEEHMLYPMIDQITGDQERAEVFARMNAEN